MFEQIFNMSVKNLLISSALFLLGISVSAKDVFPTPRQIRFTGGVSRCDKVEFIEDRSVPADGYSIEATRHSVIVKYSTMGGKLYANLTLDALGTVSVKRNGKLIREIPCCIVNDYPRCRWRGLLLDSGRQYQSVETIKAKLDLLFSFRMNVMHWHLTEGLGWRLEIKKYPELTQTGAYVGKGPEQQGFYTQEQVRDLVRYAAERNITIVPEIDIPGHAEAALYSYPEFGCFGEQAEIPKTGFTDCIFCAGKDSTLEFLKDILDEVCEIFPSEYIHLGGDEAPKGNYDRCPDCQRRIKENDLKDSHELQLWLSAQMASYLKAKGRKAIFWEDVIGNADYPLPDNVVIQWWNYRANGEKNYRKALEEGYPVICSPNYYMYLNFPETPWKGYGKDRTFSLEDAYLRNPADRVLSEDNPLTLGMECALWTDYGLTEDMLDSRLFPRIHAVAELMWRGKVLSFEELSEAIQKRKDETPILRTGRGSKADSCAGSPILHPVGCL